MLFSVSSNFVPLLNMSTSPTKKERLDKFEKEFRSHPAFARTVEDMQGSAAYEALQALQYDCEDPNESAQTYKEEGNHYVEKGDFKRAVTAYTGGILAKPTDSKLLAVLYTNRGIAHARTKNYGSSVKDCKTAIKHDASHIKAYAQAAKCLLLLSKPVEALEICSAGLQIDPKHQALIELKSKSLDLQEKISSQAAAKEAMVKKDSLQLVDIFKKLTERGILINMQLPPIGLPESTAVQISFDHLNNIHWPVLMTYPEFGQTDFLQDVPEFLSIRKCLSQLLSPENPPPWDVNKTYTSSIDELEVYYEDTKYENRMIPVPIKSTLTDLSKCKGFSVRRDLIMVLIVVSRLSVNFYKKWTENLQL